MAISPILNMRNYYSLLAALSILFTCGAQTAPVASGPLSNKEEKSFSIVKKTAATQLICVSVESQRIAHVKEGVYVKMTLRNGRNETISFRHSSDANDFYIELYDELGNSVAHKRGTPLNLGMSQYEFTRSLQRTLKPNEDLSETYNICDYYDLSHSGEYHFSIIKAIDGTDSSGNLGRDLEVDVANIPIHIDVGGQN